MLDRTLYASLDSIVSDLEAASGHRVQMMLDDLPDGFAQVHRPAADSPQTIIRVNSKFSDFAYAIAALHVAGQIRGLAPGNVERATVDERVLADLHREIVAGFAATVPAAKLPGLSRIYYDGISRQITSTLQVAMDHRAVAARCADLRQQHQRFLTFLIGLNVRYYGAPADARNPSWLVQANHRLLGVETLALAAIRTGGKPDLMRVADGLITEHPSLADGGHGQHLLMAIPIVGALLDGLLDGLTDRQLADQAVRVAGIRADWVTWIVPEGATAPPPSPMLPKDLAAPRQAGGGDPAYAARVAAAIAHVGSDPAQAVTDLQALVADGAGADQRVVVGLAEALEKLGDGDAALRTAKVAVGMDTSTDEAERARLVVNRVSAARTHGTMDVRPDVVEYLRDAISTYRKLGRERATGVWTEAAMLGMNGIALDGSKQYALKSLGKKLLTGVHLTCFTYAGTRLFGTAEMLGMLGLPYDREWDVATRKRAE